MASEDKKIGKLLRKHGYGFPQTEEEVKSFEKKFKDDHFKSFLDNFSAKQKGGQRNK